MNGHSVKFLLAVKNASLLKKEIVYFYYHKLFLKLAKVLYRAGLIENFWTIKTYNKTYSIVILLKYSFNTGVLSSLKIISKPSKALLLNFNQIFCLILLFFAEVEPYTNSVAIVRSFTNFGLNNFFTIIKKLLCAQKVKNYIIK